MRRLLPLLRCASPLLCAVLAVSATPPRAEPWPIKQFEILNVQPAPLFSVLDEGMKPELAALIRKIFGDDHVPFELETVPLDPVHKLEIENYLTEVAALYEQWGFASPELSPVVEDTNGRDAYRIYLVRYLGSAGRYRRCTFDSILVDAEQVMSGEELTDFGAMTLAHELFHAVSANTPFGSCTNGIRSHGGWITEGVADAVAADAVRLKWRQSNDLGVKGAWGLRGYYRALPASIGIFEENRSVSWDRYGTSSFWRYLAESYAQGQPAGPEYGAVDYSFIPAMFAQGGVTRDCHSIGALCAAELRWADFHTRRIFGRSLKDMYARFLQAFVQYPKHREGISRDWYWFSEAFSGCYPIELRSKAGGEPLAFFHAAPSGRIERNAAACFEITAEGPEAEVRLRVRVHDPTGRLPIQNISAVMGRPPSSVPPATVTVGDGGGTAQSAAWTFEIESGKKTYFVLANMAEDPGKTIPLDGLLVEFTILEDIAGMGTAPGPAQVFGALPILLDRFRTKAVIPAATGPLLERGMTQACSLRFYMQNSETGDGVEIHLDDVGPIVPGTYNAVFQESGLYQPPEDHIGAAVIRFGIGKGNPLSQGDAQTYGSQTGTLTIDAFTADIVSGSLTVLGERDKDGEWEQDGWRDYPDELNAMSATAEFIFQPELPAGFDTMRHCIHPDPQKRVKKTKTGSTKKEGKDEEEEEETSKTSDPNEEVPIPGEPEDMAALPDAPDTPPGPGTSDDTGTTASVECRPLVFKRGVPFDTPPGLPFRFDIPDGWLAKGDATAGHIWPPDYPDGGLQYQVRSLTAAEAAQARALNQAMFPVIAQLAYGSETVPVHGGLIGSTLNTLLVLPVGDGHYAVEMLFKGKTRCDPALVADLRMLVLDTLAPR